MLSLIGDTPPSAMIYELGTVLSLMCSSTFYGTIKSTIEVRCVGVMVMTPEYRNQQYSATQCIVFLE